MREGQGPCLEAPPLPESRGWDWGTSWSRPAGVLCGKEDFSEGFQLAPSTSPSQGDESLAFSELPQAKPVWPKSAAR